MSVLTLATFHVFKFCLCQFPPLIYFIPGLQESEISKVFVYFTFNTVVFMFLHWWHCCSQLLCSLNQICSLDVVMGYRPCEWGNRDLNHGRSRHVALLNQDFY